MKQHLLPASPAMRHSICALLAMLTAFVSYTELSRVQNGSLFMLSLPFERPPTDVERIDAELSSAENRFLAPIVVLAFGLVATMALRQKDNIRVGPAWLITSFLLAATLDLATTIHFFNCNGIENELHPGMRLFGYAYGRTIGPIIGKSIQVLGLAVLVRLLPRARVWILGIASVLYFTAALYNLWQI